MKASKPSRSNRVLLGPAQGPAQTVQTLRKPRLSDLLCSGTSAWNPPRHLALQVNLEEADHCRAPLPLQSSGTEPCRFASCTSQPEGQNTPLSSCPHTKLAGNIACTPCRRSIDAVGHRDVLLSCEHMHERCAGCLGGVPAADV